jgi:putative selenium metabolism protein SsnA
MLVHHAQLITWGRPNLILEDHGLLIKDGRIAEIGPSKLLIEKYPRDERIDAQGQYVMPGNICAHTHFYGAFARGMAIPGRAPKEFIKILQKLWWPLDQALTLEDVRYSALVCLIDAIRHGTTTLIDHHASPNAIEGSLDVIAETVDKAGLRAVLCYEVTDRYGKESARAGIDENVRFIKRCRKGAIAGGRLASSFGLHASLTLSEETLEACREAAPEGAGFHLHVAEHHIDQYDSLEKSGQRVVDRLHQHRILGERSIVAHAVHVDAREVQLLAESGTWVTHQPRSNMNNAVGVAHVESMMRAGVRLGLGNDGFSNAMWEEWKAAYLLQKSAHCDPRRLPGDQVIEMAIYNNAALAGSFFSSAPIGVIEEGAHADLIFIDYHPTTPLTAGNLPWHMLFGFHESMITATIVAGRILMRERKLLTLDEAEITAHSRQLAEGAWKRYRTHVPKD